MAKKARKQALYFVWDGSEALRGVPGRDKPGHIDKGYVREQGQAMCRFYLEGGREVDIRNYITAGNREEIKIKLRETLEHRIKEGEKLLQKLKRLLAKLNKPPRRSVSVPARRRVEA